MRITAIEIENIVYTLCLLSLFPKRKCRRKVKGCPIFSKSNPFLSLLSPYSSVLVSPPNLFHSKTPNPKSSSLYHFINNPHHPHPLPPSPSISTPTLTIPSLFNNPKASSMEDYYYRRNYIPSFGNWEWNDHLPFSHCFESTRIVGYPHDTDLYVAGDLYQNDVVTPAMIVVPRPRRKRDRQGKQAKKESWIESSPPNGMVMMHHNTKTIMPKPVDEDLYKISPDLLAAKTKKKRGLSYITNCFVPTCLI